MGKSTKTTQENKPPAWAEPLLKQAASEAQGLYNQGVGYHAYTGPTQAPLSDPTLGGMNAMLAATGYTGPRISNDYIANLVASTPAAPKVASMPAVKATPQPPWQPQQPQTPAKPEQKRNRHTGRNSR
jgi:hypothetical protein